MDYSSQEQAYKKRQLCNSYLIENLISLLEDMCKNRPINALELSGIVKYFGHPSIDYKKGLERLREKACKEANVDSGLMKEVEATMRMMIIRQYFINNKCYPLIKKCNSENWLLSFMIRFRLRKVTTYLYWSGEK